MVCLAKIFCVRCFVFESILSMCMRVMVFWNGEGFVNRMECGSVWVIFRMCWVCWESDEMVMGYFFVLLAS